MEILDEILKEKIRSFLKEDIGYGDITSNFIIPDDLKLKAVVISDESGVVAGIREAKILCEIMKLDYKILINDGKKIKKYSKIFEISGNARSILAIERTLLNILMRMSGITTIIDKLVKSVKVVNKKLKIACTRKTTPGFRYFQKRAVQIGGGDTHRYRLDDMVLIKDNHLFCIDNLENTIKSLKEQLSFSKKIELEVKTKEDALKAAKFGVDILMLDNFSPKMAEEVINELKNKNLRKGIYLELSGNITPGNILEYAKLDVDIISMGFLTHSVKALGMSLDIIEKMK